MRKYKSHQEMGGEGVSGLIVEIGERAYKLIVECLLQSKVGERLETLSL